MESFSFYQKIDYKKINDEIILVSNEKLNEIEKYFSTTKTLNGQDYRVWKLLKKSMYEINSNCEKGIFPADEEIKCWLILDLLARNEMCNEIKSEFNNRLCKTLII